MWARVEWAGTTSGWPRPWSVVPLPEARQQSGQRLGAAFALEFALAQLDDDNLECPTRANQGRLQVEIEQVEGGDDLLL